MRPRCPRPWPRSRPSHAPGAGRVVKIAIASGKGGTGKTTVATNLAARLARSMPVVLADVDVEEPNSGLFLQGEPHHAEPIFKHVPAWQAGTCRHCGQCQEVCNFNAVLGLPDRVMIFPELCHACRACSELCPTGSLPLEPRRVGELRHGRAGRLDLVESRLLVGEEQATPLIAHTLDYLDRVFADHPLVILDAPPGTSCSVVEATREADLVLLVTEPTPFGLHDLTLAVDTMRHLERPFRVVINRHGLGDDRVEDYCAVEGIEIVARIPHMREAAALHAGGQLLDHRVPAVDAALGALAGRLAENVAGVVR
ncbi:P-loop NTPase [bacterium]|nr:P-loop NTPase [bacterium]